MLNVSWEVEFQNPSDRPINDSLLKKFIEALRIRFSELDLYPFSIRLEDFQDIDHSLRKESRHISIMIKGTRVALWVGVDNFGDEFSLDINGYPLSSQEDKDSSYGRVTQDLNLLAEIYPVIIEELNNLLQVEG